MTVLRLVQNFLKWVSLLRTSRRLAVDNRTVRCGADGNQPAVREDDQPFGGQTGYRIKSPVAEIADAHVSRLQLHIKMSLTIRTAASQDSQCDIGDFLARIKHLLRGQFGAA